MTYRVRVTQPCPGFERPSPASEKLLQFERGIEMELLADEGDFFRVAVYGGGTSYVPKECVEVTEGGPVKLSEHPPPKPAPLWQRLTVRTISAAVALFLLLVGVGWLYVNSLVWVMGCSTAPLSMLISCLVMSGLGFAVPAVALLAGQFRLLASVTGLALVSVASMLLELHWVSGGC